MRTWCFLLVALRLFLCDCRNVCLVSKSGEPLGLNTGDKESRQLHRICGFPTCVVNLCSQSFAAPKDHKFLETNRSNRLSSSTLSTTIEICDIMPAEIQLGSHTLRSHGVQVARIHMHDWLILLLLVIIEAVLNIIEPFHRFVGENMMTDLSYPLKGNTIPFWAVPVIAILLPFAIISVYYIRRKDIYDLHHAILGILYSVLITGVLTDAIKDGVGRPRPDFFWRCFPDGKGVYDNVTHGVLCTGLKSVIKEGHKSFPSGHTSWSFAGLAFLSWYLAGKLRAFDRKGHVAKLCIIFLPLLIAAMIGISRVDDYWHHWQDVFAGALLGSTVASFCYLQFFPPPYDIDGWGPHAYFQMLADSRNGAQPGNNVNRLNVAHSELTTVYIDSDTTRRSARSTNPILDDNGNEQMH